MTKITHRPGALAMLIPGIAAIIIVLVAVVLVNIDAAIQDQDVSTPGTSAMQTTGPRVASTKDD